MPRRVVGREQRALDAALLLEIVRQAQVGPFDRLWVVLDARLKVELGVPRVLWVKEAVERARDVQVAVDALALDNLDIVPDGGLFEFQQGIRLGVPVLFGVLAVADEGDGLAVTA